MQHEYNAAFVTMNVKNMILMETIVTAMRDIGVRIDDDSKLWQVNNKFVTVLLVRNVCLTLDDQNMMESAMRATIHDLSVSIDVNIVFPFCLNFDSKFHGNVLFFMKHQMEVWHGKVLHLSVNDSLKTTWIQEGFEIAILIIFEHVLGLRNTTFFDHEKARLLWNSFRAEDAYLWIQQDFKINEL